MFKTLLLFLSLVSLGFSQEATYQVKNVNINNEFPHFGIMPVGNNEVIFISYQLNKKGRVRINFDGEGILGIYKGTPNEDGGIVGIEEIKIDPNAEMGQVTSAVLSADGRLIYITTTYTNKNRPKGDFKKDNYHIEVGEFKSGVGYTNFKVLPFCKPRYSYAHPALSNDGKTLYFTSNQRGGKQTTKGGSDIFMAPILSHNKFGELQNLGSKINSYSREMFPTIGPDKTLFFASNRSSGFGGYDIYKSQLNADGTYSKAEKMPEPINSKKDDLSLVMFGDNTGYVVSKRLKGKGDDDIYYFQMK